MNPYRVLRVSKTATDEEIEKAYRKRARETHPDRNSGDDTKCKAVNDAYEILKDPAKRKHYDETGNTDFAQPSNEIALFMQSVIPVFQKSVMFLISEGKDLATMDLMKVILEVFADIASTLRNNLKELAENKRQLKKCKGRFKRKSKTDPNENYMEFIVNSQLEHIERDAAAAKAKLVMVEKCVSDLQDYTYDRDEPPPAFFGHSLFMGGKSFKIEWNM